MQFYAQLYVSTVVPADEYGNIYGHNDHVTFEADNWNDALAVAQAKLAELNATNPGWTHSLDSVCRDFESEVRLRQGEG